MKRTISILLMIWAVVLLTTLEFMPHHHHGQEVCWGTECYHQQEDCCNHHHDNDNSQDHESQCVVEGNYLFSHPDDRFIIKALSVDVTSLIYVVPESSDVESLFLDDGTLYLYCNLQHIIAEDVSLSACGLRAPPVLG